MANTNEPITRLYRAMRAGDPSAESRLMDLIYTELVSFAKVLVKSEPKDPILTARGLVHDVYTKLRKSLPTVEDRVRLRRLINKIMRQTLSDQRDHLRRHAVVPLDTENRKSAEKLNRKCPDPLIKLILSAGLHRLAKDAPDRAEILRLRYIEDLTLEQAARHLGCPTSEVHRKEQVALAKLAVILRPISRS